MKFPFSFLLSVLFLASAAPRPALGATTPDAADDEDRPTCDNIRNAFVALNANPNGFAYILVSACLNPIHEGDMHQRVRKALDCPEDKFKFTSFADQGLLGIQANCKRPMDRDGLRFTANADLQRIGNLLPQEDIRSLSAIITTPRDGSPACNPPPHKPSRLPDAFACSYLFDPIETAPPLIQVQFGFSTAQMGRIAGIMGFLLLLPVLAIVWLRRQALRAPEGARTTVWFAYFRFLRWTAIAGTFAWWLTIDLLHVEAFVEFLLARFVFSQVFQQSGNAAAVVSLLLPWLLAAAVYAVCLALSSPIHELRGIKRTRAEAWSRSFWAVGRLLIPVSLFVLAVNELMGSPRAAVLLFIAAFVAARIASMGLTRAYGIELNALSVGELRDRAFALAQKAGAKLHQLYLIPTERIRMANAFAHVRQNILLTDYLLKNLTKREVDAVIGHELSHLQMKHFRNRARVIALAAALLITAIVLTDYWAPERFPSGPILYAVTAAALFHFSRKNEFAADAGSVKLTGDAEAMITSLAKLSRLNAMPMQWGRFEEQMLTHPSTMRRIHRLARAASITDERLAELLRETAVPAEGFYSIPPTAQPQGKLFSTRYKARAGYQAVWSILLTGAIIPALFALAAQSMRLQGAVLLLVYTVGLAAALGGCLILANFLPVLGLRKLEPKLRDKLGKNSSPANDSLFVSFAPDAEPRIYENNWAWDVGLLSLTRDCLCYRGEEAQFVLRREQIAKLELGPGPVGWLPSAAVYVSWREPDGSGRTINFRSLSEGSMLDNWRATRKLAGRLQDWHAGPAPAGPIAELGTNAPCLENAPTTPKVQAITSVSPRDLVSGPILKRDFLLNTLLAFAAIGLLGLGFPFFVIPSPGSPAQGFKLVDGGALYALVAVWLTRAFLLIPFWRGPKHKTSKHTLDLTAAGRRSE